MPTKGVIVKNAYSRGIYWEGCFFMERNYPWKGCGASKEITGCRFSLSVMSDNYANMILNAIKKVDTAKVWSRTDSLSTIYCGKRIHVIDAVKACFAEINDGNTHITMEMTFSKGCPGDVDADSYLSEDKGEFQPTAGIGTGGTARYCGSDVLINNTTRKFNVLSKIAFYPLGTLDYMDHIAYVVNRAIERSLYRKSGHYATELEGDINDIFDYFNDIMEYAEANISHYVLQCTLSVNSPSVRGGSSK